MLVRTDVAERDIVGSLEKGLAVIEAFDETRARLSLTDVARITGFTRAAARRYLLTLAKLGYAEFDGKFFSLTPRVLRLGYAYLSSTGLPFRVQPFLERISESTGESSSAAILDGAEVVYVARAARRGIMSVGLSIGSRLPAYCTALGRALLAGLGPDRLDAYFRSVEVLAHTPKAMRTESEIRAAVEAVRACGYALVDEELELGVRSLAVPITDLRGAVRCAINVSAHTARVPLEDMVRRFLPALQAAQLELQRIV